MTKLDRLELTAYEARKARQKVQEVIRAEKAERYAAIAAEIDAAYKSELEAAQKCECEAEDAVLTEREKTAQSGIGAKWPVGTKLVEWAHPYRRYGGPSREPRARTGRVGVVEAITRQSEHPSNLADYSRAIVGSFVIRLQKKDGSPSKQYIPIRSYLGGWFREDVDPNDRGEESAA